MKNKNDLFCGIDIILIAIFFIYIISHCMYIFLYLNLITIIFIIIDFIVSYINMKHILNYTTSQSLSIGFISAILIARSPIISLLFIGISTIIFIIKFILK
ncbi:hypothetical protein BFS06_11505 [Clostridium perfringens]|uniref:hypothetical protein n=1 Tax=Clostridium perfringens TaxID=1502 RepID=UPI00103D9DA8|nr:hypothetical protein [Clostridium perfringens]TBX14840.1 hypothetical protein BFS06_11505 [Clostridium perfringens]